MSKTSAERRVRAKVKTEMCLECNEEIRAGLSHCTGSTLAYGCLTLHPHHGEMLWQRCWKCGGRLGCSLCVPGGYHDPQSHAWLNPDLICKRCRVKATRESFLNGGPISKFSMGQTGDKLEWGSATRHTPGLKEYPAEWVHAYAEQRVNSGLPADEDDQEAMRECRAVFERFRIAEIPKTKGHKAILREKNRQNAALASGVAVAASGSAAYGIICQDDNGAILGHPVNPGVVSTGAAEDSLENPSDLEITDDDLPEGCWDDSNDVSKQEAKQEERGAGSVGLE